MSSVREEPLGPEDLMPEILDELERLEAEASDDGWWVDEKTTEIGSRDGPGDIAECRTAEDARLIVALRNNTALLIAAARQHILGLVLRNSWVCGECRNEYRRHEHQTCPWCAINRENEKLRESLRRHQGAKSEGGA